MIYGFCTLFLIWCMLRSAQAQGYWEQIVGSTPGVVWDIDFVDANRGWMVQAAYGGEGTILFTGNGGDDWVVQPDPTQEYLYGCTFLNPDTGWVCGLGGRIMHTTNGGQLWTIQDSPSQQELASLFFSNASQGWIAGGMMVEVPAISTHVILHTNNGGLTWQTQLEISSLGPGVMVMTRLEDIAFADSLNGIAVGGWGKIYVTSNGGDDWNPVYLDSLITLSGIAHLGGGVFCAGGCTFPDSSLPTNYNGIMVKTYDYGLNWLPVNISQYLEQDYIAHVEFPTPDIGWAVTSYGYVLNSLDSGENWQIDTLLHDYLLLIKSSFPDPGHGWAASLFGEIYRYTDTSYVSVSPTTISELPPISLSIFPNPFNAAAKLTISLPAATYGSASLSIYNLSGSRISQFTLNSRSPFGTTAIWEARDRNGMPLSAGIYFVVLEEPKNTIVRRLILMK